MLSESVVIFVVCHGDPLTLPNGGVECELQRIINGI